ncbi:MAG: DUF4417 domain-containing protein [Muribaculaceae bacterium]|nr:DUF4417 domain-containing protein [Muribaculaceae bacterium]
MKHENPCCLFSRKELFRLAHDANGNSLHIKSIPPVKRRKIMDDNMHLMEGMEFNNGFPVLKPYNGLLNLNPIAYSERSVCPKLNDVLHFFIDDYRFRDAVWYNLERTTCAISGYDYVFTPDLSLWCNLQTEFYNIKNIFRTRFVGAYWQLCGFNVIPTASWGGLESFSYCFAGLPEKSVIAVSAVGARKNCETFNLWLYGLKRLILEKTPSLILIYGEVCDISGLEAPIQFLPTFITKRFRNDNITNTKKK